DGPINAMERGTNVATDKTAVRKILDQVKAEGRSSLTAPEGKLVCDAYGIAVPKEGVATSAAEAARLASGMGFPVVLKIVSPEILHKTEAGGVLVGLHSAAEVEQGFATIMANAKRYDAKAKLLGVQVQQMLAGGQEVIVGAVTDPSFGKLVAFGLGGVLVEVLKDITFRLAPASPEAVAVIGASAEEGKIGNSVMKNLINGGYQGAIYPIHPKAGEIMGHKAYPSVKAVPGVIDVAVFAIPAKFVAQALVEVGEKGI